MGEPFSRYLERGLQHIAKERNLADEFMPPSARIGDSEARRLGLMIPREKTKGEHIMKALFRRHAVDFEATQWTGHNLDDIRKLVGTRKTLVDEHEIEIFNPIGTYLPGHLYDSETPRPTAELWEDDSHRWRPVYVGEWIVQQDEGWLAITQEWLDVNCIRLDDDMLALIREEEREKTFEEELDNLLNKHSMENDSGTPDFILASYLKGCLDLWNTTVALRANWRGESVELSASQKLREGKHTVPVSIFNGSQRNDIGEAEIKVWPGEAYNGALVTRVMPVFEYDPEDRHKYPPSIILEAPAPSFKEDIDGGRPE
jgi:hypothetical protein